MHWARQPTISGVIVQAAAGITASRQQKQSLGKDTEPTTTNTSPSASLQIRQLEQLPLPAATGTYTYIRRTPAEYRIQPIHKPLSTRHLSTTSTPAGAQYSGLGEESVRVGFKLTV